MSKIKYQNRCTIPIVHADGSLEARQYFWEVEFADLNTEQRFHHRLMSYIFVHREVEVEDLGVRGNMIKGNAVYMLHHSHHIRYWSDEDELHSLVMKWLSHTYNLDNRGEITRLEREEAVGVFYQTFRGDQLVQGFTTEIEHHEDYDPKCAVCTEYTKVVRQILESWLKEAIFVEPDWNEQGYFLVKDMKRIVILKASNKPLLARIGEWFVENFEETIKLAAISKIHFREYGANYSFEFIIDYDKG